MQYEDILFDVADGVAHGVLSRRVVAGGAQFGR